MEGFGDGEEGDEGGVVSREGGVMNFDEVEASCRVVLYHLYPAIAVTSTHSTRTMKMHTHKVSQLRAKYTTMTCHMGF